MSLSRAQGVGMGWESEGTCTVILTGWCPNELLQQ